jgi:hypothetical protein
MAVGRERMEEEKPEQWLCEDEDKGGRNQESLRVIIPYLLQDERFQHAQVVATEELNCWLAATEELICGRDDC